MSLIKLIHQRNKAPRGIIATFVHLFDIRQQHGVINFRQLNIVILATCRLA
ncbi:Uncharacterised protein [Vibrio cholerae]|nr:Uncharacterised protein [Vibrio cholerae]